MNFSVEFSQIFSENNLLMIIFSFLENIVEEEYIKETIDYLKVTERVWDALCHRNIPRNQFVLFLNEQ